MRRKSLFDTPTNQEAISSSRRKSSVRRSQFGPSPKAKKATDAEDVIEDDNDGCVDGSARPALLLLFWDGTPTSYCPSPSFRSPAVEAPAVPYPHTEQAQAFCNDIPTEKYSEESRLYKLIRTLNFEVDLGRRALCVAVHYPSLRYLLSRFLNRHPKKGGCILQWSSR